MSILKNPIISLVVLTFNEEKNIRECILSANFINNIFIIDSFSIDKTLQIANKYTKNIFFNKFSGNFTQARAYSLSKTNTPWVLILDADETLSPKAEKVIRSLIQDKNVDGYWFPRRNYINKKTYLKHGYFYPDWQLRLFRNHKGYKYSGVIHAQIQIPNDKTRYIQEVEIYHNSSHTKYDSFLSFSRFFNYIKVEGEELVKTKPGLFYLFRKATIEPLRHFYRSFVKLSGYKDGYCGFRAAVIWGMYEGAKYFYALKKIIFPKQ